jgi:hypothetical protein
MFRDSMINVTRVGEECHFMSSSSLGILRDQIWIRALIFQPAVVWREDDPVGRCKDVSGNVFTGVSTRQALLFIA